MKLAKMFVKNLFEQSNGCRIKTKLSCPTRIEHEYIKGRLDGEFYSIEVIYRMYEKPALIIRDFTECKKKIQDMWEQNFENMKEKFITFLKEKGIYEEFISAMDDEINNHLNVIIADRCPEEFISSAFDWEGDQKWIELDAEWREYV